MAFRSKRERFIKVTSFLLFVIFIVIVSVSPAVRKRIYRYFSPSCIGYSQARYSNRLTDRVVDYSGSAKASGINECKNENEIKLLVKQKRLVRASKGRYFITDRLTYSYPYLTKNAGDLLDEIGKRFNARMVKEGLRGSKFIVTSMTRTTEKMKGLRKNNNNASMNSPHLTGNAFDISYVRFKSRKLFLTACDIGLMKEALAQVIVELREEKQCWATYERQQSCFHVVAR